MNDLDDTPFDVVIVGCGPVGQTLANLLGQYNLQVCILDREAAYYPLPRAVQFDSEIMRVFQAIGLAETIAEVCRLNPGTLFRDKNDNLLLDWSRPMEISDQQWHASYRFHQPDLESILLKAMQRFPDVQLQRGVEFLAFEQTDDQTPVICHCRDTASEETFEIKARFVVGCDGANSSVSKQIGPDIENLGFEERWLVCDLILNSDDFHLGDHTIQICDAERPMTYVRTPGRRRRWEIRLGDDEFIDNTPNDIDVWKLLSAWLDPDQAVVERAAIYTFRSRIASQWKSGKVFLAGDAAHQMPPFMGQGMCAGIRDASNLAWKLACTVGASDDKAKSSDGSSDPAWLDSYEHERKPNVRAYIETSIECGKLLNNSFGPSELKAAIRREDGTLQLQTPEARLGRSAKAGKSGTGEQTTAAQRQLSQTDKQHRSTLSTQFELENQQNPSTASEHTKRILSDEICVGGFILYCSTNFLEICSALPGHSALSVNNHSAPAPDPRLNQSVNPLSWAVITEQHSSAVLPYLTHLQTSAVLIRPDRYIAGTLNQADDLMELLNEFGLDLSGLLGVS